MNRLLPGEEIDGATRHYDTRTLKAVGEWLGRIMPVVSTVKGFYLYPIHDGQIDQLKQGKMPEGELGV